MNSKTQLTVVRPMQLTDIDAIQAMHKRLSATSMQFRYLGGGIPPTSHFEFVYKNGAAFVATAGADVVGIAYYVLENEFSAEIAFLIEDAYQKCGLGWQFFEKLIAAARAANIQKLGAYVCSSNRGMIRLVEKSNLPYDHTVSCGTREFTMRLNPTPALTADDMIQLPDFIQFPTLPSPIAFCVSLWRTLHTQLAVIFSSPQHI